MNYSRSVVLDLDRNFCGPVVVPGLKVRGIGAERLVFETAPPCQKRHRVSVPNSTIQSMALDLFEVVRLLQRMLQSQNPDLIAALYEPGCARNQHPFCASACN